MTKAIQEIKKQFPSLLFADIQLPKEHTLNDMLVNYGPEGILTLLNENTALTKQSTFNKTIAKSEIKPSVDTSQSNEVNRSENKLLVLNQQKIAYKGQAGQYYVLGTLSSDLASLKLTLQLEEIQTGRKHVKKLDLFENDQVYNYCLELSEKEGFNANLLESDLRNLSDLLTSYRDQQVEKSEAALLLNKVKPILTPEKEGHAVQFLVEKNLVKRIDELIANSGVIGEENDRTLLFICASTYTTNPLHVLVQGSSGSGKSHLINAIKDCLPGENTINLTRVTSKSFYHYKGDELMHKLIVIQDFDGLDEEAQLAFREAQSAKNLSSSTVFKDKFGNLNSHVKYVNAHFSSMVATTRAEVYYDNMSRSVIIGVDESDEQTRRIISYQNKKIAGLIDQEKEQQARQLLQNCVRVLKPKLVINRYADKIHLPMEAKMLRRLNEQFQLFTIQVAFLHQYQRELDEHGRVIATPEDLRIATDLFFSAIWLKVDELDNSTRQFFEQMKIYVKRKGKNGRFTQREIRQALNQSKSQCFRYFTELQKLEYIAVADGSANRGFNYHITEWKPMNELKEKIKKQLYDQIDAL